MSSSTVSVTTFCNTPRFWQVAFLICSHHWPGWRKIKRDWVSVQESDSLKAPEVVSSFGNCPGQGPGSVWPSQIPQPPTAPGLCRCSPRTGSASLYRQWVCVTAQFLALREGLAHAQTAGSHLDPRWHRSKPPLFGFLIPDWRSLASGDKCRAEDNVDPLWLFSGTDFSEEQNKTPKTLVCLRDWIESKRPKEAGPGLSRGWQVHWGVNCLGVQWVYSEHTQRLFSSRSFKSKCVKGARGGICINGISWGLRDWGVLENEKKRNHPPLILRHGRSLNDSTSPSSLGPCPNHVHHWPTSLLYSFRLPLAIFYRDMEISFSLAEVLEGSCFWRDHIYARAIIPHLSRLTQGPRVKAKMSYSRHHRETTVPVCKSPLRAWPESYQEDGKLVNFNLSMHVPWPTSLRNVLSRIWPLRSEDTWVLRVLSRARDQCFTFCLPTCTLPPQTSENRLKAVFLQAVPHRVKLHIPKNRNTRLVIKIDQRWKWGRGGGMMMMGQETRGRSATSGSRVGSGLGSPRLIF